MGAVGAGQGPHWAAQAAASARSGLPVPGAARPRHPHPDPAGPRGSHRRALGPRLGPPEPTAPPGGRVRRRRRTPPPCGTLPGAPAVPHNPTKRVLRSPVHREVN